jgi:pyruvate formate lyase activating enzyme
LTGVSNSQTLQNFASLARRLESADVPCFAPARFVPGYVDLEEIHGLARFIAALNPEIPYSLLGFYPQFVMNDLPVTSRDFAFQAQDAAQAAGLKRVRLGNLHLLC